MVTTVIIKKIGKTNKLSKHYTTRLLFGESGFFCLGVEHDLSKIKTVKDIIKHPNKL